MCYGGRPGGAFLCERSTSSCVLLCCCVAGRCSPITCLHARQCAGCRRWGLETQKSARQALRWVQKVVLGDPQDRPVCWVPACQAVRWVQKVGLGRPRSLHARQCAGCRRWCLETHKTGQCAGCLHARQCAGCRRWGLETHLTARQAVRWVQKVVLGDPQDRPVCWVPACQAVRWVQKVGLGDPLDCTPGSALGAEGGVWRPTCLHARQCAGCRRWGLETHKSSQCAGWLQCQPLYRVAGVGALVQCGW